MARQQRKDGRLPRNAAPIEVTIDHIGGRGDGVGKAFYTHNYRNDEHTIFVPAALPGERVLVQPLALNSQGIKSRIIELQDESPDRRTPACDAFPACGGCNFQHWSDEAVTNWKEQLAHSFLTRAGVTPKTIRPFAASPMASRRRAVFHIKRLAQSVAIGFAERQGTHIVFPSGCSILDPDLFAILGEIETFAAAHFPVGWQLDLHVNKLDRGLCLFFTGTQKWSSDVMAALAEWAGDSTRTGPDIARISVGGNGRFSGPPMMLYAPVPASLRFGTIEVVPPPGAFLQATTHGEALLQAAIAEITDGARIVADLFAGCGTLSLPLLPNISRLIAAEQDSEALSALKAGADAAQRGGMVQMHLVDLANAPLLASDLAKCDAVILDPPRAGAAAQCAELVHANVPTIAMVSCNPATFARDAAILCDGGHECEWLQLIDQFRMTNHVELVAKFTRSRR